MTLGLLILVSVGKENIYLSTQPEITFFKIAYKRYTNFSIETIAQYFKTIPDFGRRVTVNISKNADLLSKCFLYVSLPDIISSNSSVLPPGIKKFAWDKKIGLALIRYIDLEIGGILIERHFNDWLNIWYELTTTIGKKSGYNKMIGDIELLTSFTNGKKSYGLNIPLNFWFCQDSGLSLPLVAMIHNDIKIHVEFNNFDTCFIESPTHYINVIEPFCLFTKGETIMQNIDGNIAISEFVYFDYINQNIYYNKLNNDFIIPTSVNTRYAIIGSISKFETNISIGATVVRDEPYFRFNTPSLLTSYLLVNYIYLDNEERFNFVNKTHEYLIPIIQNISEQICYSGNVSYKIPFINPNKIIFWRCCLVSNIQINDLFNYSLYPLNSDTNSSIVEKQQIILNSIPRMDLSNWEYYSKFQIYLNNFCSESSKIYMYSFSLNALDYQPSGSLNFSQIDDSYIQLTLNKKINYNNIVSIKGFGLQYNIFRISNGLSGLGYVM